MQVCFVANEHDWNVSFAHDVDQLLVDDFDDFERLLAGNGIHENVPMEILKAKSINKIVEVIKSHPVTIEY